MATTLSRFLTITAGATLLAATASPALAATPVTPIPPGAPKSVTAKLSGATATIAWKAPAFTAASKPTGYTVTSSPAGLTCTVTALTCKITIKSLGVPYTFIVAASNAAGFGPSSDSNWPPVTAVNKPTAPTGTSAYLWNAGSTARVSWQSVAYKIGRAHV